MSYIHVRPSYNNVLISSDVNFWNVRMHVFPKGLEEMHAYIAEILRRMFSYDTKFGSVRILGFSKGSNDSYGHKAEA
jgi:hypothetical protein